VRPYTIVLADDHALFRQGVKKIIEEVDGLQVVGEAKDGLELLELLKEVNPALVILDISMPNLRGLEAALAPFRVGTVRRVPREAWTKETGASRWRS
jgi:YesN/AraC family two-component response regulator